MTPASIATWFSGYFRGVASQLSTPSSTVCESCGGDQFYTGPQGGLAFNIRCANEECRRVYCYMGLLGTEYQYTDETGERFKWKVEEAA